VGLLRFDSDVPGDFDEADLEQLQPLAHAVAVALDNARLFRARQESESRLRTALEEKEVLLREIHHRVKNNLQIIAGLLELQYNATEDELVLDLLTESQARIQAIALIHEKLYQSDGLSRIDVAEYVRSLVGYLAHAYDVGTPNLNVQVRVDDVSLDLDTMVPCALIINELVANALQHAFPPDASPSQGERRVDVELRADDGAAHLCVADNGRGLPPHLDLESTPSLGLKLVRLLTLQLNGSLTVERHGGTAVHVNFALPKEKRA
jgi:hypothetical protein